MISVDIAFIFFSAIVFLGFVLNAFFSKIRIANVFPLLIIGLLIGPIFHIIPTSSGSIISELSPYITAIAISFILFEVGMEINFSRLGKILPRTIAFTFIVTAILGVVLGTAAFYLFSWGIFWSFIFGFAIAGPSSMIVPTLVKIARISDDLKEALLFEAVFSDILTLIVPLVLLAILISGNISLNSVTEMVTSMLLGSIFLAIVSALFWLYMLKKFPNASESYGWMLTIAMVVATYGTAEVLGFNGAITTFLFGLIISNLGTIKKEEATDKIIALLEKRFSIPDTINRIKSYQKEIIFFVSTFFFVYLGMIFQIGSMSMLLLVVLAIIAVLVSILAVPIRYLFIPILKPLFSKGERKKVEKPFVYFDVSRGLAPAVIATLPLAYGLTVLNFSDMVFLVILASNIIATIGIFVSYKDTEKQARLDESIGANSGMDTAKSDKK